MKFACPECGETKRLRGEREADVVHISCQSCGHRWDHDTSACPNCGERMYAKRVPLLQKARGTQQSIIGFSTVKACPRCEPPEDRSPGWLSAT